MSLMNLYKYNLIDILKIDIEGSEKQLFNDQRTAALFLVKTKYIAIEIHDEVCDRNVINDCLSQNNFSFFTSGQVTIGVNNNLVPGPTL